MNILHVSSLYKQDLTVTYCSVSIQWTRSPVPRISPHCQVVKKPCHTTEEHGLFLQLILQFLSIFTGAGVTDYLLLLVVLPEKSLNLIEPQIFHQ
jgi:hypothetical protein